MSSDMILISPSQHQLAFINVPNGSLARQLNRRLPPQELHQDRYSLTTGHHPCNDRPETVKYTAGYLHRLPGLKFLTDFMHPVRSQRGAQLLDNSLRHHRPAVAKMDDATNSLGVANPPETRRQFKPREQVIGEQGLREPNRPTAGGLSEPNARQVNFEIWLLPQMGRRNMLMLGLCANAKPRWRRSGKKALSRLSDLLRI
jgi:hypothetical protein